MNRQMFERRRGDLAVVPFICLLLCVPLWADETPAKPKDAVPAGAVVEVVVPARGELVGLSNTQYALSAIHLATNADPIGADVAQVDDVLRSHLGLGEGKGLVVTGVGGDTPAARAGIQKNDVLIAVGNEEIAGLEAFRKSLEASVGKPVSITLMRAGKKQAVDVTPRSNVVATELLSRVVAQGAAEPKYWLGVGLAGADDTLRSQLSLAAGEGLVVTNVENDSPAAKAGVLVNDLLLKLDGKALTTIEALSEQLQTIADKSVPLELLRRGKPATLTVTPEKHADSWQQGLTLAGNDLRDVILFAPRQTELATFTATIGNDAMTISYPQAKPDLVRQLGELETQVKQLEASLAALRAAIEQAK